ncbi:DUF982 domain-containing protein [Shinella sp. CPCC 101442]|uniref:DUF982 domain-containing protein n=1 Tax=Shinella sp. CPCC 101442 TaxID=2932265 RepID=UPI0021529E29|nr:DUF982 domain-containing protein [Shinella sp. CPCC 101442]MCR6502533.1 DUF982 domain-containing protein [Shinella sp. CPCC 101442]
MEWKEPIEIQLGTIGTRKVEGPFEALIYLIDNWPNRSGPDFVKAKVTCKAAVEGRADAEVARRDFLAAAKEVHCYMN